MPHARHRSWIDIQKKHAGFYHAALKGGHDTGWTPNADIMEHADGMRVVMELAGVEPASVQIVVANTALIITGTRTNPQAGATAAGYRFRQMEIEYGAFERVLPLPWPVDPRTVQARATNGLLEINLPRATSVKPSRTVVHITW
jgi:HSP20 family protein